MLCVRGHACVPLYVRVACIFWRNDITFYACRQIAFAAYNTALSVWRNDWIRYYVLSCLISLFLSLKASVALPSLILFEFLRIRSHYFQGRGNMLLCILAAYVFNSKWQKHSPHIFLLISFSSSSFLSPSLSLHSLFLSPALSSTGGAFLYFSMTRTK